MKKGGLERRESSISDESVELLLLSKIGVFLILENSVKGFLKFVHTITQSKVMSLKLRFFSKDYCPNFSCFSQHVVLRLQYKSVQL